MRPVPGSTAAWTISAGLPAWQATAVTVLKNAGWAIDLLTDPRARS